MIIMNRRCVLHVWRLIHWYVHAAGGSCITASFVCYKENTFVILVNISSAIVFKTVNLLYNCLILLYICLLFISIFKYMNMKPTSIFKLSVFDKEFLFLILLIRWRTCRIMLIFLKVNYPIISDRLHWHDTRDKWPLARNPDRSWWHLHTNWKFFLAAAHGSMDNLAWLMLYTKYEVINKIFGLGTYCHIYVITN